MSITMQNTNKKLVCDDLHTFIKSLPQLTIVQLYNYPASCLAVFRELPDLAKHHVMRLLFIEQPITQSVISAWINNQNSGERLKIIQTLTDLYILQQETSQLSTASQSAFKLNDIFRKNLRVSLMGGGESWTGSESLPPDKYAKDISFLDIYAQERWHCILHYMVQSKDQNVAISRDVIDVLVHAGLIKPEAKQTLNSEPFITASGFQFLLLDITSQIWFFLLKHLETLQSKNLDLVDCLTFLFQLSFSTLGKDYSTEKMSENQQKFLQLLRELGLVYQRKRKSQRFYPTRLAVNLTSSVGDLTSKDVKLDSHNQGFIVVETNFRVYAYTASSLQLSLLALFSQMIYRFPNMTVGSITRESVRGALTMGITADQIVNFLISHSHAETQKNKPVIPPTVSDQIYLWELERDRFHFADGILYSQFVSQSDFELLRDYAKDLGVLIWENPQRRILVVTRGGHDEVRRFWKRHRHDNGS